MHSKAPSLDALLSNTMALAIERKTWRGLSLVEIAKANNQTLSGLYATLKSKRQLLEKVLAYVDQSVLAEIGADAQTESAKDRLFEVLMARIDAITPFKDFINIVVSEAKVDPVLLTQMACLNDRSMTWMLEAAHISSSGYLGRVKSKALGALWFQTLCCWLEDSSVDCGKTMAFLNHRLEQLEKVQNWCSIFGNRNAKTTPASI